MKRARSLSLTALVCLAILGSAGARAVPDLTLTDLAGHHQKLSSLRGNIVVLSFWATWCGPCQEELPRLSSLSDTYSGKPVKFVAVSIDEARDRAKVESFLVRQASHLDCWTGADTDTMARVGLGVIVPSTVILDERGEAITRISGEARVEDITTSVDWLLGGRVGTPPAAALKRY
jgi:thiol-disulfide isomerase/thioredoxin